jgi:hypothetical protein
MKSGGILENKYIKERNLPENSTVKFRKNNNCSN